MMNRRSNQHLAFTLIELLVIIVIIAMLLVLLLSGIPRAKEARKKQCVQNLKQVALAFRQWTLGGGDRMPMLVRDEAGGAEQSVARGEVFRVFQVMSNELGNSKILVCPSDNRRPAPTFVGLVANTNTSYFVGFDAQDIFPQMFLSGDRNLEVDGVATGPGIVALTTNNLVDWTRAIHNRIGNVGLADGSVQSFDKKRLSEALAVTGELTNRLVFP